MAAIAGFWLAGRATEIAFDRILADDARVLAAQVHWNPNGPVFDMDASTAASLVYDSLAPSHFTVRTLGGQILVGDPYLQPPAVPTQGLNKPIFQNRHTSKGQLRVVALLIGEQLDRESVWVLVAEDQAKRLHMRDELAQAIFLPAVLIGFVILPLLVGGVRYGLKLASRTSDNVTARSLNDLSPLSLDDVPQELRPLVMRINALLEKLQATLAHERQFIAEAAHQLRTPVSGIRLLTKDLMRSERDNPGAPVDHEVLAELDAAAGRATHLVQQLLSLARAEAGAGGQRQTVMLHEVAEAIVTKWQRAAKETGKSLTWMPTSEVPNALQAIIDPMVLQDALENLIENALLHGGANCQVTVRKTEPWVSIEVFDDGTHLQERTLMRMREPFWRAAEAKHPGSGLGLSIAEKAAVAFGGHLDIASGADIKGTRISLCLPLANTEVF